MTTRFVAQPARFHPDRRYPGARAGAFEPGAYAKRRLPGMKGTALFTYCFRRFGYPQSGWDGFKSLARYATTTPDPRVFLTISPYVGGSGDDDAWLSFGFVIEQEIDEAMCAMLGAHGRTAWEQSPLYKRSARALRRAIDDLLRPVRVDDVAINCCGPVDGDADGLPASAEYSHAAGYGIPHALLEEPGRYGRFLQALRTLGERDLGKGMERVIALVAEIEERAKQAGASALSDELARREGEVAWPQVLARLAASAPPVP